MTWLALEMLMLMAWLRRCAFRWRKSDNGSKVGLHKAQDSPAVPVGGKQTPGTWHDKLAG